MLVYKIIGGHFVHQIPVLNILYGINLDNNQDIISLFKMTPYYYKTSKEDTEKLLKLETLTTTVHFAIEIYKKVGY